MLLPQRLCHKGFNLIQRCKQHCKYVFNWHVLLELSAFLTGQHSASCCVLCQCLPCSMPIQQLPAVPWLSPRSHTHTHGVPCYPPGPHGHYQSPSAVHLVLTAMQVLFSRWLGQQKQGLSHPDQPFLWPHADKALVDQLKQSNMHSFDPSKHQFAKTDTKQTHYPDGATSKHV